MKKTPEHEVNPNGPRYECNPNDVGSKVIWGPQKWFIAYHERLAKKAKEEYRPENKIQRLLTFLDGQADGKKR